MFLAQNQKDSVGLVKMAMEYVKRKADNLGNAVSVLTGAGILGQFPQFLAQYLQRLGGHIDEAKLIQAKEHLPQLATRISDLEKALHQINEAGTIGKLFAFAKNVDLSIASRALENYAPGVTFNNEGLLYCGVGALLGYVTYEFGFKGAKYLLTSKKGGRNDRNRL